MKTSLRNRLKKGTLGLVGENEKNENKREKDQDSAKKIKRIMEHEGDRKTSCNWRAWNDTQMLCKGTEEVGNLRTCRDYLH